MAMTGNVSLKEESGQGVSRSCFMINEITLLLLAQFRAIRTITGS